MTEKQKVINYFIKLIETNGKDKTLELTKREEKALLDVLKGVIKE